MGYIVHHINCGTMCAGDRWLFKPLMPRFMSSHCLVIESNNGLVVIDTGFGTQEIKRPQLLGQLFNLVAKPVLKEEETAIRQIEKMGYKANDVTNIILTHMHLDHAGGVNDFPGSKVHVHENEYQAATHPKNALESGGYLKHQWREAQIVTHTAQGDKWFGFEGVRPLNGDDNIVLIPVPGHSMGHCAVAVKTKNEWILHCGDAYFDQREMTSPKGYCPPGLKWYQKMMNAQFDLRMQNRERLRELYKNHPSEVRLICSHDHHDFCQCAEENNPK